MEGLLRSCNILTDSAGLFCQGGGFINGWGAGKWTGCEIVLIVLPTCENSYPPAENGNEIPAGSTIIEFSMKKYMSHGCSVHLYGRLMCMTRNCSRAKPRPTNCKIRLVNFVRVLI